MAKGIPIYIDERKIPAFHPIHLREEGIWYPSNEAASLLVHINHVWDDIQTLSRVSREREDKIEQRLLFKYIIVELHSILSPLLRLQTIIMTSPERMKGKPSPWRSVTAEEKGRAKVLFKSHHVAKSKIESEVSSIRHNIGAHRMLQPWEKVIRLWDSLVPSRFVELLNTIPPIFNFAKELDLYDWARTTQDGAVQILGSRLNPEGFESSE